MAWKIAFAILLLLGIAGFLAVPSYVGLERSIDVVGDVGPFCLILYFLNFSMVTIIPAISWWILMRTADLRITFADTLRANLFGFPINLITPSAYIGAEPVKALYLSKKYGIPATRILATIVVAKFQEVAALILAMLLSAAFLALYTDLIRSRDELALGVTFGVILTLFALFIVAYLTNFRPITRLLGAVFRRRIARRRKFAEAMVRIRQMEQIIHDSFTTRWRSFLTSQAITLLSAFSIFLRLPLFIWFTDQAGILDLEHMTAYFLMVNLVNLFQIIPASLGVLDGAILLMFSQYGLADSAAAAFSIVTRISDAILFLIGLWLLFHHGLSRYLRPREKGELRRTQTQAWVRGEDGNLRLRNGPDEG